LVSLQGVECRRLRLLLFFALSGGRCGEGGPPRWDSLSIYKLFLLGGYISFQTKRNEIMKVNELLISVKELPWQKPISFAY
jgi:hypothetical protein